MYIYLHSEPQLWTVGFYDPTGKFQPESDHDTAELAAVRVAFLNGGSVTPDPLPASLEAGQLRRHQRQLHDAQPAKGATPQPAAPRRLVGPSDLGEGSANPDATILPLD